MQEDVASPYCFVARRHAVNCYGRTVLSASHHAPEILSQNVDVPPVIRVSLYFSKVFHMEVGVPIAIITDSSLDCVHLSTSSNGAPAFVVPGH